MTVWNSIGNIEISNEWQFLPLNSIYLVQLRSTVSGRKPDNLTGQLCLCDGSGVDMLTASIKTVFPAQQPEIVYFRPPYPDNWVLGAKLKSDSSTLTTQQYFYSWKINILSPSSNLISNITPSVSTTASKTTVNASTQSLILLAANSDRKGATFYNESSANLFLDLDETASLTDYTIKIKSGSYYELPFSYIGDISGIWDGSQGYVQVRELT